MCKIHDESLLEWKVLYIDPRRLGYNFKCIIFKYNLVIDGIGITR